MSDHAAPGTGPGNRLAAVVVTHDRADQLRATLAALLAVPGGQLAALVVVDNASTDGTAAVLAEQDDPRLTVLRLPVNIGGAGGFQAGMRHAIEGTDADWLVVMDDDARPEPGALAAFHALDLRGLDGVAAAVRHPDGTICEMNRPTLNPFRDRALFWRTLLGGGRDAFHLGPDDFAGTVLRPVDGASFVGFFLRCAVVKAVGYPDARLFLYGDDAIYTLGLTQAGYRLAFAPQVRFEHDSETWRRRDPRMRPLWKVYYYHRNLLILYRQATGRFFWPVVAVVVPKWLLRLRHHRGERWRFLRLMARALRDGLAQRTGISHQSVRDMAEGRGRISG